MPPTAAQRHRTWSPRISDTVWQRYAMPHSPDALLRSAPNVQLVAPVSGYSVIGVAGAGQTNRLPPPAALRHRTWSPCISDVIWQRYAMPQSPDAQRRSAPHLQLVAPVSGYSAISVAGAGQRIGASHRRHCGTALGRPAFLIPFGSDAPCHNRQMRSGGRHPTCSWWRQRCLEVILGGWGGAPNRRPPPAALRHRTCTPRISGTIWQRCAMPHSPNAQWRSAPTRCWWRQGVATLRLGWLGRGNEWAPPTGGTTAPHLCFPNFWDHVAAMRHAKLARCAAAVGTPHAAGGDSEWLQ